MVTFYMKSRGLDGTPVMHLRRKDAQGNYILGQANTGYRGIYHPDWVRCQHTFETLPGTVSGALMLHVVYGNCLGEVWIDDLSIRELPVPLPVALRGKVTQGGGGVELFGEHEGIQVHRGGREYGLLMPVLMPTTAGALDEQRAAGGEVVTVGWCGVRHDRA